MCLQQMLIVFNFLTALCGQMVEFGNEILGEARGPFFILLCGVTVYMNKILVTMVTVYHGSKNGKLSSFWFGLYSLAR